MPLNDYLELPFLIHISLVFVLVILSMVITLTILRRKKGVRAERVDRLLKKHKDLFKRLSAHEADLSDDTIKRLKNIGNDKDIEIILEKAADLKEHPLSHFRTLLDAVGVTDRYLDILKNSNSWKQRAFAAEKLGHIGSVRSVPHLLSVVRDTRDEDEDVRATALRALGRIRDKRAIPFLIEALGYPETWLPPRIGEILVSIGEESIEHLIKGLKDYKSATSRGWAAEILGWLEAKSAVPQLLDALFDVSPEVRAKAAGALGKIGDDRAVNKLTELLISDPVPFVRVRIANALGEIGHPAVIDYLINVLKDPEWWVRVRAVEALEQLGDKAVSGLLIALEEDDVEVRRRAAMALERIGYVEKILDEYGKDEYKPELKHVLFLVARAGVIESMTARLTTSQVHLVKNIVRIFGEAGTKEASGPLLELLALTTDWTLKARIIEALGKVDAQEAIPPLINYIKDNEYWVRKSSVDALGILNAQDHVDDIARILDDPNPIARESSLIALSGLKIASHQEKIEKLFLDPSSKVRGTALMTLRELGFTAEREKVIVLLKDTSEEVRIEGIRYFAERRDPKVFNDIIRLLSHGSEAVRQEVVRSLRKINPKSFNSIMHLFNINKLSHGSIAAIIEVAAVVRDKDAHHFLVYMTKCSDALLREKALNAVISFGLEGNEKLFEKGFFDPSEAVRIAALTSVASDAGQKLIEKARALSKDPVDTVRMAFVLAVGALQYATYKALVIDMLNDPSRRVAAGSVISMAALDNSTVVEFFKEREKILQLKKEISLIREELRFKPVVDLIRSRAHKMNNLELSFLLTNNEREYAGDLIKLLNKSVDPDQRVKILEILKFVNISEFFTLILRVMKQDPSVHVRLKAMDVVTSVNRTEEIISILSSMMFDLALEVRCGAAGLLAQYKHPKTLEALFHVLDTSDRQFRETVTTSLSKLLSEETPRLDELVKNVPSTTTRKLGMAWLMGKARKRGALKYLVKLLDDGDSDVRASALGAIGKFRRKQLLSGDDKYLFDTFMDRLGKCIYDPNERVRAAAVNAIVAIGGERAFTIVQSALGDVDEYVRKRAAVGIAKINTKKSLAVLNKKAAQIPHTHSYVRGISYAAGLLYDKAVKHDKIAKSIVDELCPEEKMYYHFKSSSDKSIRLHAFHVLALTSSDRLDDVKQLALKDPLPEVREKARSYLAG